MWKRLSGVMLLPLSRSKDSLVINVVLLPFRVRGIVRIVKRLAKCLKKGDGKFNGLWITVCGYMKEVGERMRLRYGIIATSPSMIWWWRASRVRERCG